MTHGISSKRADVPQFTQNPTGNPPNLDHVLNYSLGHPHQRKEAVEARMSDHFLNKVPLPKGSDQNQNHMNLKERNRQLQIK